MAYLKNILILLSLFCHESSSNELSKELEAVSWTKSVTFERQISLGAGILSEFEVTFPDLDCPDDEYGDNNCTIARSGVRGSEERRTERVLFRQKFKSSSTVMDITLGLQIKIGNRPTPLVYLDVTQECPVCSRDCELHIPDQWYDLLSFYFPSVPDPIMIRSLVPSWLCVTGGAEVEFETEWRMPLPYGNRPMPVDVLIGVIFGFKDGAGAEDIVNLGLHIGSNITPEENPSVHRFEEIVKTLT